MPGYITANKKQKKAMKPKKSSKKKSNETS